MDQFNLETLAAIIKERSIASSKPSYTKSLLDSGIERVAKKFGEESVEAVIAAVSNEKDAIISEAADVMYHLLVLLQASNVSLENVYDELARRTGQSGLEEKAGRKNGNRDKENEGHGNG